MTTFYVYIYQDPERNVPMYVGKGCGGRYKFHIKKATNIRFKNRIITLKNMGMEPIVNVVKCASENDALLEEIRLIKLYGRKDLGLGTLYNMTDGGEGSSGWKPSEQTKKKIGDKNRNPSAITRAKQSAWVRTDVLRQKISEAQRKTQASMTEEQRAARSLRQSKENLSIETRNLMSKSAKERPAVTCPHCGKVGKAPGIRRHHFEYCKVGKSHK